MKIAPSAPFPISVETDFLEHIKKVYAKKKLRSVSELVRASLKGFNFASVKRDIAKGVQISVRLDGKTRKLLRATSRKNNVSTGKIVREAVIAYIGKDSR